MVIMGRQSPSDAWRIKNSTSKDENRYDGKLIKETDEAYVVKIKEKYVSLPKSIVFGVSVNGDEIALTIPGWLAKKKGLKY